MHNCERFGQHQGVRATETLNNPHRPDGKVADVLAPTHAHTIANALVNYRGCVLQRPYTFPIALMGKLLMCLPRFTLAQLRTLRSTTGCVCHRNLENFPAPMGIPADLPKSTLIFQLGSIFNQGSVRVSHASAKPHLSPMGKWLTCLPRLTLAQSERSGHLQPVRAAETLKISHRHRPDGKIADVLASTHTCTTANASVNISWCVPQRP